jgi:hypothetical protein
MPMQPSGMAIEQALKDQRVEIDRCIKRNQQIAMYIARGTAGREVALAITKLQEAKMWLGKALEEIGYPLPEEYRDEAK